MPAMNKETDNNKAASYKGFPNLHFSWDNNVFPTWREAVIYARKWLGEFDSLPPNLEETEMDYYNYKYSGYGDRIAIRLLK